MVTRNLGDGLRLFLAGIALEKVLGVDLHLCIILIGAATIVYTFFGGMKAVIWSDCVQLVIYMIGGALALRILIGYLPGGWAELMEFGRTTGRLQWLDFRLTLSDAYTFWAGLLGGAALTLGTHGTDQMLVQRYLSARSGSDAQRAVVLSGFVVLIQFAMFLLLGVAFGVLLHDGESDDIQTQRRGLRGVHCRSAARRTCRSDPGRRVRGRHVDPFQFLEFFGRRRRRRLLSAVGRGKGGPSPSDRRRRGPGVIRSIVASRSSDDDRVWRDPNHRRHRRELRVAKRRRRRVGHRGFYRRHPFGRLRARRLHTLCDSKRCADRDALRHRRAHLG